jgi:hypothetical protein
MDCNPNMHDLSNINNHIKSDRIDTMSYTETDQARIDRLKRYQEQEDREADERRQDGPIRFYTLGYGSLKTVQDLADIISKNNIQLLLDVRSKPNTRRFSKKELEQVFGKKYQSRPEMGGFDHKPEQYHEWCEVAAEGLGELILATNTGNKVLIMCAEKNPNVCHRKYFVARALEEGGHKVRHL